MQHRELITTMTDAWWSEISDYATLRYKGTPTLKHPADLWIVQEIVYDTQPDVIVETGTKFGGSANYYADLGVEVVSVDVACPRTPTPHFLVTYLTGFSTSMQVRFDVARLTEGKRVMVVLDSDHSKANVLAELEAYHGFVTPGCYMIVEDTVLGRLPHNMEHAGNGPADALDEWLPTHPDFTVDKERERLGVTFHPGGWLKRAG